MGRGREGMEAMAKMQVVWSQEKDRFLELVMDDLEMGGTGEEWAEVLGRLDIQQSCTEEEMVEVTREERPKAGLRAMDVVAEEEMFLQTKIIGLEVPRGCLRQPNAGGGGRRSRCVCVWGGGWHGSCAASEGGGYEVVGGQLGHQDCVPECPEEVGPSGGGETAKDPH